MQKDFFITKPKIIEGLYGIIVLQSEIIKNNEIRKITQILCNSWEDNTILDQDKLDFLINIINKYQPLRDSTICAISPQHRAAPSVEAHHRSDGPDTGRNSGGRRIINKVLILPFL